VHRLKGMAADPRFVLILDDNSSSAERTARAFQADAWTTGVVDDVPSARAQLARQPCPLIVSELRIKGRWAFDFLKQAKRENPGIRAWILTDYPSIGTAVRATRLGIDRYLAKPLEAGRISALLERDTSPDGDPGPDRSGEDAASWPSLDRTIWELINQVLACSESLSDAARRLHLDRRSLRRMLAKYPPAV
jgi:two-component system, response regulator RegA